METISVVTPVFNETECLPLFYERVRKVADGMPGTAFELLFVDDGSMDGSFEMLSKIARSDPRVRVLKFSRNFGSYTALTAGLVNARGAAAVTLSADLQDPPELIPELLRRRH